MFVRLHRPLFEVPSLALCSSISPSELQPVSCTDDAHLTPSRFHDLYIGYFVCYGTVRLDDSVSWRFPFGMQAVMGIIFSAGSLFLPHSPRWLKHVGREVEATAAWFVGCRMDAYDY